MNLGQAQVRLPTLADINDRLKESMLEAETRAISKLLEKIAEGEGLSLNDLKKKYLRSSAEDPTKKRKVIDSSTRCLAKISGSGRCSRKRKTEYYCGGHIDKRPHGEYMDDLDGSSSEHSLSSYGSTISSGSSGSSGSAGAQARYKPMVHVKLKNND
jgi:ribosomal protein L15